MGTSITRIGLYLKELIKYIHFYRKEKAPVSARLHLWGKGSWGAQGLQRVLLAVLGAVHAGLCRGGIAQGCHGSRDSCRHRCPQRPSAARPCALGQHPGPHARPGVAFWHRAAVIPPWGHPWVLPG